MNRECSAVALLAAILTACGAAPPPPPSAEQAIEAPEAELLATYWPTPEPVVQRMLDMAGLQAGETHFDLGSGDGRYVLAAARRGADSTGFEIDPELIAQARRRIAEAGLQDRARIEARDLLEADFAQADVITCFLVPESYPKVIPVIEAAVRPGTRVVAYKFPIPGWEPVETFAMEDPDPEIPTHEAFLYRR